MPQQDKPEIVNRTCAESSKSAAITFILPNQLPYFEGHFPTQAILPGFIQIHWIATWAVESFNCLCYPLQVRRAKFLNPLLPGETYQAILEISEIDSSLNFTISLADPVRQTEFPYAQRGNSETQDRQICSSGKFGVTLR